MIISLLPLVPNLPFYCWLCSKHDAQFVSKGHWRDIAGGRSWPFGFLCAVSYLSSASSALLLEVVCSIPALCLLSLPSDLYQPGDHLTDWHSQCPARKWAPHSIFERLLLLAHRMSTSSGQDNAMHFTIQRAISIPPAIGLDPNFRKLAYFPSCSFLGSSPLSLLKNKTQPSKFEDLLAVLSNLQVRQHPT